MVFSYEREPETPSYAMAGQVPLRTRRSRRARLLELQQRLSRQRLARRIGERVAVMVDGPARGAGRASGGRERYAARTAGSAYEVDGGVVLEGHGLAAGTLVPARITGASAYDLFGAAEPELPALALVRGQRA